MTAYGGGSSRSLSSASAASSFIVSAPKTTYTRRDASNGRMCRSWRSSRMSSIRIWSPSGSSTYRSGWVRRSTRAWSPRSSAAKRSARSRLPTPEGPCKRYACAGPSTSAAFGRRFASCCSDTASKSLTDHLRQLLGGAPAVEGDDALGETLGELPVRRVDASVELGALALEPVRLCDAPPRLRRVDQKEDGQVRHEVLDDVEVELEHVVDADAAGDPLVRERRVDVAVRDHVRAPVERRTDDGRDELGARGREQRRLRPRRHVRTVEHELAHALPDLGAARLARQHDFAAIGDERIAEELGLRRLPRSVDSFEGHEHVAPTIGKCARS